MPADPSQPENWSVFQDWRENPGNLKSRLVLLAFRAAFFLRNRSRITALCGLPFLLLYRVVVEWMMGIEIPHKTRIGRGLRLYHGVALVINDQSVIGEDCVLRHCTTLGNKILPGGKTSGSPVLGDRVDVGAHVVILGPVSIGEDSVIGAGSVVIKDVPARAVVAGNPARVLRIKDSLPPGSQS